MMKSVLALMLLLVLVGCGAEGGGMEDVGTPVPDAQDTLGPDTLGPDECGEAEGQDAAVDAWPYALEPVVFAVVSDIHIDGSFEESIPQKVVGLLAKAAAVDPAPELIAITGDLTDQMAEPVSTADGSIIDALQKVIASSQIPVEPVLGNHDYYAVGDAVFDWTQNPVARTKVFENAIGLPPWHYTVHGGMKFIYLNSAYGPMAQKSLGLNGALGKVQLDWLEQTLSDRVPAILFLHHPPTVVLENPGVTTLPEVITDHADHVLAVFVGHIHVWATANISGVPVYITAAGFYGKDFHHVRVDPVEGTVEILNADSIDYGQTDETPCEPQRDPGLEDPDGLTGATLVLQVPDGHIEPMGLGSYLRELVGQIPMAVQLGPPTDGETIPGYFTIGKTVGDGAGDTPPHLAPVPGGTCSAITFAMDGPCFTTSPASLLIDLGKMLGFPLPPGWKLRAELKDLYLSGALLDGPTVERGVLRATIDFNVGAKDLEGIIVTEYCAGHIPDCMPGEGTLPVCPAGAGADFYESVPQQCDVELLGIGLRLLFDIFASIPGLTVDLDANFTVYPAVQSPQPDPGTVALDLFDACIQY